MNAFVAVLLLAVAASASHIGLGIHHGLGVHHGIGHHIPSGSVSVGHDGAVIAGPSGSVHTDNGLHGHGAGARLSGPAGEVGTHGGHAALSGPGIGHHGIGHIGHGIGHVVVPAVHHVAPVHHVAVVHGYHGLSHGLVGHGAIGHGLIGHHHHGW